MNASVCHDSVGSRDGKGGGSQGAIIVVVGLAKVVVVVIGLMIVGVVRVVMVGM